MHRFGRNKTKQACAFIRLNKQTCNSAQNTSSTTYRADNYCADNFISTDTAMFSLVVCRSHFESASDRTKLNRNTCVFSFINDLKAVHNEDFFYQCSSIR